MRAPTETAPRPVPARGHQAAVPGAAARQTRACAALREK